jgi:limonene-1,2-epoxide hydrolase
MDRRTLLAAAAASSFIAKEAFASERPMSRRFQILDSVIAAWRAKDIDAALSHMHDDIVWHYAAAIAPPLKGKAQARRFLENFAAQISEVKWRIFDYAENGDRLFVEGVDEYIAKDGARVAAPYAGVVEFKGDLIIGWRDYFDRGVVDGMKAGGAASAQVEQLIARPSAS